MKAIILVTGVAMALTSSSPSAASKDKLVSTVALDREVRAFLRTEVEAHLAAIPQFDPPPQRVHGALTTGEFTWGTFMRALAAYAQLSGDVKLANRDLARAIGEIGLIEVKLGGTRFSQLYAALSLRSFGSELGTNRLWQSLSSSERDAWRTLLDPTRFYDPVKREAIALPENYLGVAARIAAVAADTGLLDDRRLLDSLLDRAAKQFTGGALYADDALPAGRYDRYSNEYARYLWEAAQIAGRRDVLDVLRPSVRDQMRLWWDLLSVDGYGYQWGRSVGAIGYMDTLEIAGFLAVNPEFRPAPLEQLAAAYNSAWRWLSHDYKPDRHLLSVFDFGRGNFAYITREREWQQTTGFLGKLANAHGQLLTGLREAGIDRILATPQLPPVARFQWFKTAGRQAGVWVVRRNGMQFALPFTTATQPGVADYLPAPHGLRGFAVPVEQKIPALVPFLELADGRTIVAADGVDALAAAPDGQTVKATWTRWAQVGAKAAELIAPGLTAEVEWRLDGSSLVRVERLIASDPLTLSRWTVAVPSTGQRWETHTTAAGRIDTLSGSEGRLGVSVVRSDWPIEVRGQATGDSALGKGARGHVPLLLYFEGRNITLEPGKPRAWTLRLDVE